jgi:uncharacterized protein
MIRLGADRRIYRQTVETLLIGAAGGLILNSTGFPAGLISGSVLAVAAASLAGRPLGVPQPLARVIFVLSGIAIGSAVTPATLHSVIAYPLSIAVLVGTTAIITGATWLYLRYVHRWDSRSALYGASPGALAQILVLSVETGADVRGIVVVQTVRVVVLTLGIPAGLAVFGLAAQLGQGGARAVASAPELLLLVAASVVSAFLLLKLRFPGGLVFGAMIGSALLHGTGIVTGGLPWGVAATVMVALGTVNGSRFAGTDRRMLLRYFGAAFGSFAVSVGITVCFASLVASALPVPAADIVIAYAPGAQDTMMLLALALKLDPVFVGAHHLARFLTVSLTVPFIARALPAPQPPV